MSRRMKDSGIEWIGEIPEDWEIRKLDDIADSITDYVASGSFASLNENVQYLDEPDYAMLVRTVDFSAKDVKRVYINRKAYDFLSNSNLFGGEIIMSNIGSVGNVFLYEPMYEKASLAPNAIMLRMKGDNRFYYYWFVNPMVNDAIKRMGNNAVQLKFNKTQLRAFRVVNPSANEQIKIANFLDSRCTIIDQTIEKQKQIIEKLKECKQSIITEAVTKGLDPSVKMKDSGVEWIGEIPEHWEVVKLGIVGNVQTGPFGSQLHNDDYVEEGTPIITVEHFGENVIKHYNLPYVSTKDYERLKKYIIKTGDLIFSRVGSVDRCVLVSEKEDGWLFSGRCLRVRFKDEVNSKFICYCFNKKRFREYMNLIAVGSTMPSINTSILNNIRVPVPSINEQESICKWLTDKCRVINNAIDSTLKMVNKLETYKKSLIYEYVTGKREVK